MKRFLLVFALLILGLHVVSLPPVLACTPTPQGYPPYTLADQVNVTPMILEGTVTAISGDSYDQTATVSVQQYLKGTGPAQVTINRFGSSSMCLTTVSVGDHLLFFVSGDPATGLNAFYMSAGAAIKAATPETIAEVQALVAPVPPVQSESSVTPWLRAAGWVIGLVAAVLR